MSDTGLATDVSTTPVYLADSILGPTPQAVDLSDLLGLTTPSDTSIAGTDISSLIAPTSTIDSTTNIPTIPNTVAYDVPSQFTAQDAALNAAATTPSTLMYMFLAAGVAILLIAMTSK